MRHTAPPTPEPRSIEAIAADLDRLTNELAAKVEQLHRVIDEEKQRDRS